MNKVLLNDKGRNHIKFFPQKDTIVFDGSDSDKLAKCKMLFEQLRSRDDIDRLFIHKNSKKGYLISVWEMDNLFYLVQSIRDENKMYNNTIYILNDENDSINIAKFLQKNCEDLMNDYRQQIIDGVDEYAKFKQNTQLKVLRSDVS